MQFEEHSLPELGLLHIVLSCPFSQLYYTKRFNYWLCECDFDPHLHVRAHEILPGWHNVELSANPRWHSPSITSGLQAGAECWKGFIYYALRRLQSLCSTIITSESIIVVRMVWRIATPKCLVHTFISLLGLAFTGTIEYFYGDSRVFCVRKWIIVSSFCIYMSMLRSTMCSDCCAIRLC